MGLGKLQDECPNKEEEPLAKGSSLFALIRYPFEKKNQEPLLSTQKKRIETEAERIVGRMERVRQKGGRRFLA